MRTLFLGGGTPSHLKVKQLEEMLRLLNRWFPLQDQAEFSIEANPSDITQEKVDLLKQFGVNRVSLGVQSFDRSKLRMLERDHDERIVRAAIERIQSRISNVAVDLIFGVPGETESVWRHDVRQALSLGPRHVSTYGLTIEKGAAFYGRDLKGEFAEVQEEQGCRMYETGIELLTSHGFEHYEVSNFAQDRFRCEHNVNYWMGGPYFAIGPGASGYVNGRRFTNHRSTTTYMKRVFEGRSPVVESEILPPEARARERLVFQLRMLQGIDERQFQEENRVSFSVLFGARLDEFVREGFLERTGSRLKMTRKGLLVSDSIWPYLL